MEEAVLHSPSTPKVGSQAGHSPHLYTAPRFSYSPHRPPSKNTDDQSQFNIPNANVLVECGGLKAEDLVYVKCNKRKWVLGSIRQVTERGIKVWLHSPQTMANVSLSIAFTHILMPLENVYDCRRLPNSFSLSDMTPSGIYELRSPVEIVRPAHLAHRQLFHTISLASLHVHDQDNRKQNEETPKISVPNSSAPSPSVYYNSGTPKRRLSFSPHELNSLPFQHNFPAIRKPSSPTLPANESRNNKSLWATRRSNNAFPVESKDRNMLLQTSLSLSPGAHAAHAGGSSSPILQAALFQNGNMGLISQGKFMGNLRLRKVKSSPP